MAEASKSYADLVRLATSSGKEYDLALIEKGYKFAFDAHKDQVRQSGEPYIIHPIAVACKLIEFGMDTPVTVRRIILDNGDDPLLEFRVSLLADGVVVASVVIGTLREPERRKHAFARSAPA